ncbi:MAG TPA: hypothetical protein VM286_06410 [Candidatus Thermoplasmatota archaeon]|nr:hypothetical protein [Candidatus Thermoplasmatota archaeon]
MDGPRRRRGLARVHPIAAAAAVAFLSAAAWLPLDVDGDGASAYTELRGGTDPTRGDTDGDGLADGWEASHGLAPLASDSDRDALGDATELRQGSDPKAADSDRDGVPDRQEPARDCDRDGTPGVRDGDDDGDHRADGLEAPAARCQRDEDGDGVPDGYEGNAACLPRPDCDGDGVPDAQENGTAFDALDPDTFRAGVPDSVSWAFQESGQAPGTDADRDGIPDGWEPPGGLVDWGDLQPVAGQKDLLVEYLRVAGPDSGRFGWLDFTPGYRPVAAAFLSERGVHLRWTETRVPLATEPAPPLVPTSTDPYYADLLPRGRHSANPYVTTVVLNPQHDQGQVLHAGVAPIRGVLAAVDYGAHVRVSFRAANGAGLTVAPILESVVRGGRSDLLAEAGFDRGGSLPNGDISLHSTDLYSLTWTPSWFRTPPLVRYDGGSLLRLNQTGATVDLADLSTTILHELGHTLGLCHSHEPDCNAAFTAPDRAQQATSSMSYDAPSGTLHYLGSEWSTVLTYLTCPPQQPLLALARHEGDAAVRAAKYAYADAGNTSQDVRACADFTRLPHGFRPDEPRPASFTLPPALATPRTATRSLLPTGAYAAGALVACGLVSLLLWHRRRAPGPPGPGGPTAWP